STIMRSVSRPKYSSKDRSLIDIAPLPLRMNTRATEVFLLPVAVIIFSAIDYLLLCFNRQRLRLLCFVGMLGPRVDLKFSNQSSTQAVLWQHPLNGQQDKIFRFFFQHLFCRSLADPSRVIGVAIIDLLLKFFPGKLHATRINDDHKIASIGVGGKNRLV